MGQSIKPALERGKPQLYHHKQYLIVAALPADTHATPGGERLTQVSIQPIWEQMTNKTPKGISYQ